MKQVAWFGQVDPQSGSLTAAGGVDQMVEKLIHSSPVPEEGQPDLRMLEYNRLLSKLKVIYDYVSCHDKSLPKTFISPFKTSSKCPFSRSIKEFKPENGID